MIEIGLESHYLQYVLSGQKTIEARLGKTKFLKLKRGDELVIREDIWKDDEIVESIPGQANIIVNQVLYFETFEEMLESINYKDAIPSASNIDEALSAYRQFYSKADELEFGVVAIEFSLI